MAAPSRGHTYSPSRETEDFLAVAEEMPTYGNGVVIHDAAQLTDANVRLEYRCPDGNKLVWYHAGGIKADGPNHAHMLNEWYAAGQQHDPAHARVKPPRQYVAGNKFIVDATWTVDDFLDRLNELDDYELIADGVDPNNGHHFTVRDHIANPPVDLKLIWYSRTSGAVLVQTLGGGMNQQLKTVLKNAFRDAWDDAEEAAAALLPPGCPHPVTRWHHCATNCRRPELAPGCQSSPSPRLVFCPLPKPFSFASQQAILCPERRGVLRPVRRHADQRGPVREAGRGTGAVQGGGR